MIADNVFIVVIYAIEEYSDLLLLEAALLQFGRLVSFEQLASLFASTDTKDAVSKRVVLKEICAP